MEPLTGDVALIITDFADEDEVNDTIELWNKQMDILHRNLGGLIYTVFDDRREYCKQKKRTFAPVLKILIMYRLLIGK